MGKRQRKIKMYSRGWKRKNNLNKVLHKDIHTLYIFFKNNYEPHSSRCVVVAWRKPGTLAKMTFFNKHILSGSSFSPL